MTSSAKSARRLHRPLTLVLAGSGALLLLVKVGPSELAGRLALVAFCAAMALVLASAGLRLLRWALKSPLPAAPPEYLQDFCPGCGRASGPGQRCAGCERPRDLGVWSDARDARAEALRSGLSSLGLGALGLSGVLVGLITPGNLGMIGCASLVFLGLGVAGVRSSWKRRPGAGATHIFEATQQIDRGVYVVSAEARLGQDGVIEARGRSVGVAPLRAREPEEPLELAEEERLLLRLLASLQVERLIDLSLRTAITWQRKPAALQERGAYRDSPAHDAPDREETLEIQIGLTAPDWAQTRGSEGGTLGRLFPLLRSSGNVEAALVSLQQKPALRGELLCLASKLAHDADDPERDRLEAALAALVAGHRRA